MIGDAGDARKLFDQLRGSNPVTEVKPGVFTAPGANGGMVTFRATSKSGPPTVDVHGIEEGIRKIKFVDQLGRNRVSGRTAGGKQIHIDLRGRGHYDKAIGQRIETPHVHEATINVGPNGERSTSVTRSRDLRPNTTYGLRSA